MTKRIKRIRMPSVLQDREHVQIHLFPSNSRHIQITSPTRITLKQMREQKQPNIDDQHNFTQQSLVRKLPKQPTVRPPSIPKNRNQKQLVQLRSRSLISKYQQKKMKLELKNTIFRQKVIKLGKNFIEKIKRNNIFSAPLQHDFKDGDQNERIYGIDINEPLSKVINTLFVINILITVFTETLSIVFSEITASQFFTVLQVIGITIYLLQIVLNMITVRFSLGRKLETLTQISRQYISQSFSIDLINIIIIILNFATSSEIAVFIVCKIFILLKIPDWLERIKKLEIQFIQNYYKEQYWSLIKVFLFNFLYAHFLSIVLLCMANVNSDSNWLITKGITNAPWYQKYIWSYYWSTTIMLTIGFGDIVPTCYQEACFMIFIETISCIILAYNINCVGTLISNIRFQDVVKHNNLKIFKKLAEKNKVSDQLSCRINNFIEQHSNIKKMTNIDEQAKFVENLPNNYKAEYLKQSNKNIFKQTYFFNYLMEKTLCTLAEKIQAKMSHPLQVLSDENNFDLLILKKGEIACKSNKKGISNLKKYLINEVTVDSQDLPFLLHTNFITKERHNYKIISTVYSLIYYMDFERLMDILRNFARDFELYCQLRDKCKYEIDEFQVFQCNNCNTKHTEFQCPKYHYIPIRQHVIHREVSDQKLLKNQRYKPFVRVKAATQMKYIMLVRSQKYLGLNQAELSTLQEMQNRRALLQNLIKCRNKKIGRVQKRVETQVKQESMVRQIKEQIMQLFRQKEGEDNVWLVQSDKLKNFKNYFPKHNPDHLGQLFNSTKRTIVSQTLKIEALSIREIGSDKKLISCSHSRKKLDDFEYGRRKNQRLSVMVENIQKLQELQLQQLIKSN